MTDRDASDPSREWIQAEVERVSGQLRGEAKQLEAQVLSAISRVLIEHKLDGDLTEYSGLNAAVWKLVGDRLVEKMVDEILEVRHRREHEPKASTPMQTDSFRWRYNKHTGRLTATGRHFQRDLATIGEMIATIVAKGKMGKLDTIIYIYDTANTTRILRGHNLDRWIASIGKSRRTRA
jgi:hypothetical protein